MVERSARRRSDIEEALHEITKLNSGDQRDDTQHHAISSTVSRVWEANSRGELANIARELEESNLPTLVRDRLSHLTFKCISPFSFGESVVTWTLGFSVAMSAAIYRSNEFGFDVTAILFLSSIAFLLSSIYEFKATAFENWLIQSSKAKDYMISPLYESQRPIPTTRVVAIIAIVMLLLIALVAEKNDVIDLISEADAGVTTDQRSDVDG